MNFFKNTVFLSRLVYNNIREYFKKRETVSSDAIHENSLNWYGHATVIININNKNIITDPVLGNRVGFFKRVAEKPYNALDIKFDYILLSHGHMDHLDFNSLRKLNKDAIVIVPKGYNKILRALGFKKVFTLRHNGIYEDEYLKITSFPANHDGRRFYLGIDDESNSYLIESSHKKVFFAGDTAYIDNYKGIQCDVAIMPVGCYKPERFTYMHCTPEEGYKMFKTMSSKAMIPVHYKTFKISLEDFSETYSRLKKLNDPDIKIIDIGETYKF